MYNLNKENRHSDKQEQHMDLFVQSSYSHRTLEPTIKPLSERELEVLQLLASGTPNREIGRRLSITEGTVKRHVYNIFCKLNVRNRTQAALQACRLGVAPHPNFLQLWEQG